MHIHRANLVEDVSVEFEGGGRREAARTPAHVLLLVLPRRFDLPMLYITCPYISHCTEAWARNHPRRPPSWVRGQTA